MEAAASNDTKEKTSSTAKTGDPLPIVVVELLSLMCAAVLAIAWRKRRA